MERDGARDCSWQGGPFNHSHVTDTGKSYGIVKQLWLFELYLENYCIICKAIDYSFGLAREQSTFVYLDPAKLGRSSNLNFLAIVQIFNVRAWTFIFVALLSVAILFTLLIALQSEPRGKIRLDDFGDR